jgi:lysophospholipase L1-like esterase
MRRAAAAVAVAVAVALASAPPAGATSCQGQRWLGAWAAPPSNTAASLSKQTLRLNLTPLKSGRVARIRLSNRFGTRTVTFGRVRLGKQRSGARLVPGSDRIVRFGGRRSVQVAAGKEVLSDPVRISVRAFQHLAVSVYLPGPTGPVTQHLQAHQTSFAGAGDLTAREGAGGFSPAGTARPFVTGLDVRASSRDGVVAAIGDSITDGDQRSATVQELGVDEDARYPDFLARRLAPRRFSVLNLGIGGNRVLTDLLGFAGPSLLNRLDPDLLHRPDVTDVILLEGINDLGFDQALPADTVIDGLRRAVRRMHALRRHHRRPGLNVLVGTLTPSFGAVEAGHASAATEQRREEINAVIRAGGVGDGVVDFDRALRDPADPLRLAAAYNSGDGLHPSSAGYRRMAQAVDLAKLDGPSC